MAIFWQRACVWLTAIVVGCGGGEVKSPSRGFPNDDVLTRQAVNASVIRHTGIRRARASEFDALPQTSIADPGVPNGRAAHGPYRIAPVHYPANDPTAVSNTTPKFISVPAAAAAVGLGRVDNPLRLANVLLTSFATTESAKSGKFRLYAVSPHRMVYEVTAIFSRPYSIRGNTWSSGKRVYLVDASTGDVLYSVTTGTMTTNSGRVRSQQARSQRSTGVMGHLESGRSQ
jgi:hypothetical protein